MIHYARKIFVVCLVLVLCSFSLALPQPQTVPRLTERHLSKASYVKLAKEWKEYIKKTGETADALVNLGMAYNYSEQLEAALVAGRRAVEIDPDNPKALAFLGKMLAVYKADGDAALTLLEHCREVAPDYKNGLTNLTAVFLKRGELAKSEEVLKTLFEQRIIPQPLQDYAYNMLIGLPHGAVLITNGDNDTFPPLALQAGMDFRNDVIVINRSLFNVIKYDEAIFKRNPSIRPRCKIEHDHIRPLSDTLLKRMVDEQKAPIYFAASVSCKNLGFVAELPMEGMNRCSSKRGLTNEDSARLFIERYRLDSVTDWNFAWDLVPSIAQLMYNYVACMIELAQQDDVRADTKQKLLDKALDIATFHDMTQLSNTIRSLQNK